MAVTAPVVTIHQLKTACSSCSLRELCLPMGISREEVEQLDRLIVARKRVRRGENLYYTDDRFHSIYAEERVFQEHRPGRGRTGSDHRVLHARRNHGHGWYRHGKTRLRRRGPREQRGMYHSFREPRRDIDEGPRPATAISQTDEPRNRPRPKRDDVAREHARRGTSGGISAQSLAALCRKRLFAFRFQPADEA